MGYRDTLYFASKRVRVRWWRFLWTLADAADVAPLFGIKVSRRGKPCRHSWWQTDDINATCSLCGATADVCDVLDDYKI